MSSESRTPAGGPGRGKPVAGFHNARSGHGAVYVDPARAAQLRAHYAAHGVDPATKAQTAAHEAGHAVIYTAMGRTLDHSRIWPVRMHGRTIWEGWSQCVPLPSDGEVRPVTDLPRLLDLCAENLAGFNGEFITGHHHESSSLDERMKVMDLTFSAACAIAPQDTKRISLALGNAAHEYCLSTLRENAEVHTKLAAHLEAHQRIDRDAAAKILAAVKRCMPPWREGVVEVFL